MNTIIRFVKSFFLIDLLKGLWITLKYTPQPAFTFQYPAVPRRATAADRAGHRGSDLHRLRSVRQSLSRRPYRARRSSRARPKDQSARLFRFQPVALQLLRSVFRGLTHQANQGADHERGLRARQLQPGYPNPARG